MVTARMREDHAAHVVAYWQNKYCQGAYKPLRREWTEGRPQADRRPINERAA